MALMMTEYLSAAETKKKFKLKIRANKDRDPGKRSGFLALPKGSEGGKRILMSPLAEKNEPEVQRTEMATSFDAFGAFDEASPTGSQPKTTAAFSSDAFGADSFQITPSDADDVDASSSEAEKLSEGLQAMAIETRPKNVVESFNSALSLEIEFGPSLSQQVRSSAGAALIRGPPATRHFGGNRLNQRGGVGSCCICGIEKTGEFYIFETQQKEWQLALLGYVSFCTNSCSQ